MSSSRDTPAGISQELLLGLSGMAVIAQLYLAVPLVPAIIETFPDAGDASLFGAAFGGAYAVGFLLLPPMAGRVRANTMLPLALSVLSGFSLAAAAATSWPALLTARAAQGLTASAFTPAVLGFVARHLPPMRLRRRTGGPPP